MIELVVFDMAGTTVDDHGLVYEALRGAVEETGASVSDADLQTWMGTDKISAIIALMELGGVEPSPEIANQQFARFKQMLAESYRTNPPLALPGAEETLIKLHELGIKTALTTGFDRDVAEPLLASLGWIVADAENSAPGKVNVDALVTTDDVPAGRPAPYMIHLAMQRTGVYDTAKVVAAGDTAVDVAAATSAGVISVGVLSGKATRDELAKQPHDCILNSVLDVLTIAELGDVRRAAASVAPQPVGADCVPDNDYLLLTPGPLSTSKGVRAALLKDLCTWDDDYQQVTQDVRNRLVELGQSEQHSAVLMQGSGTFIAESLLGSLIGEDAKLLIAANGAYGRRAGQIAQRLSLDYSLIDFGDTEIVSPEVVAQTLDRNPDFTHLFFVHCETTTGALNPLAELCEVAAQRGVKIFVDAMSSFGGIPIDMRENKIDALISSANKCIQGVPGFAFALVNEELLAASEPSAKSLSLDLVSQFNEMESGGGKWRFTSPTHTVRAFRQALIELAAEGGVAARYRRYQENQRVLVDGCQSLGLSPIIDAQWQSPVITAFRYPNAEFDFREFYLGLKKAGFVIYPGKVTDLDTFRIGTIGEVWPADIARLIEQIAELKTW